MSQNSGNSLFEAYKKASGESTDTSTFSMDNIGESEVGSLGESEEYNSESLLGPKSEDTQASPSQESEVPQDLTPEVTPAALASKELLEILDGKGNRKQIEVDFSDRETLKKTFQDRHNFEKGMRKMQTERDAANKKIEEMSKELATFELLKRAYEDDGVEGIIDTIAGQGQKGFHQTYLTKKLEEQEWLKRASPEQLHAKELQERLNRLERDQARREAEVTDKLTKAEKHREETEQRQLDSMFLPAMDKYGFKGKLGDSEAEELFDDNLFESVKRNLSKLVSEGDQDIEVTPALIEQEFKKVSSIMNKRVSQQVEKKTDSIIQQKKNDAKEAVQSQVKSSYKQSSVAKEHMDLIRKGSLAELFRRLG